MSLIVSRSSCWLFVLGVALWDGPFAVADEPTQPPEIARWLQPQAWERDTEGPILELGEKGAFDDMHIFAPCVALERRTVPHVVLRIARQSLQAGLSNRTGDLQGWPLV